MLGGLGGLNKQGAWPARTEEKGVDKGDGQSKVVCWGCGAKGHQKWTSSCPAKDKECQGCKKGNFMARCKPKKDGKVTDVVETEEVDKKEEAVGNLGLLSPGVDSGSFFSFEPGVQKGHGTLHPKASLKPKTREVVVGSSLPFQHSSWDSIIGFWCLQDGNLCKLGLLAPAQGHHVWIKSKQRWVASRMKPHPKLKVRTAVSKSDYEL